MATAIAASMLALRFLTKKAARIVHVSVEMSYISYSLCPKSPCFGSDLLLSRTSLQLEENGRHANTLHCTLQDPAFLCRDIVPVLTDFYTAYKRRGMKGWSCCLEPSRPCCCCKALYHVHHLQLCTGCKSHQLLGAASRSSRVKPQHLLRWSMEEANHEPLRILLGYGTETNSPRCSCTTVSSEHNRAPNSLHGQKPQHGQYTLVSCSHFQATGKEAPTGSVLCWPLQTCQFPS